MELLVVISIVAILAAFMISTISVVRVSSLKSACMSNLHQFGLGFEAYSIENDGYLPDCLWQQRLNDYINENGIVPEIWDGAAWNVGSRIGRCPAAPVRNTTSPLLTTYNYPGVYYNSLPWNDRFFCWVIWSPLPDVWYAVNKPPIPHVSKICRPNQKVLLCENWSSSGRHNWGFNQVNDCRVRMVHKNTTNLVFVDQHVASIRVYGANPNPQWYNDMLNIVLLEPMWRPYLDKESTRLR